MILKEGELKVFYKTEEGINVQLDDALIDLFKSYGYRMWASGTDLTTMVRDLAFERKL